MRAALARWQRAKAIVLLSLVLTNALQFKRIFSNYFVDVDALALIASARLHHLSDLRSLFGSPLMGDLMPNARFFRPLASLSWGLDELLWGLRPWAFHLTDFALHVLTGFGLYLFTRRALLQLAPVAAELNANLEQRAHRIAWLSALLFTINPAQAEFVPVIARRADLLATCFFMLSCHAALRYAQKPQLLRLAALTMLCLLGLLSKEIGIVIPFSVVLLLALSSRQNSPHALRNGRWLQAWPLLLASGAYLCWHSVVLRGLGGYAAEQRLPSVWQEWRNSSTMALLLLLAPGHVNGASVAIRHHVGAVAVGTLFALLSAVCWSAARAFTVRERCFWLWISATLLFLLLLPLVAGQIVPRQMYLHSTLFAMILWQLCETHNAPGAADAASPSRTLRRAFRVAAVVCVCLMLSASPVIGVADTLDRWSVVSALSRHALESAATALRAAPRGVTVFLVNFPYQVQTREDLRGLRAEANILLDHSVQGFVDLKFAEQRFDVVGLTFLSLSTPDPRQLRACVRFDAADRRLEVATDSSAVVTPFPWPDVYGRHNHQREFSTVLGRWPWGPLSGQGVLVELPRVELPKRAVFLIYEGKTVELRPLDDFEVGSCS